MGDLFGEIPVSLREMQLWLFKVPRLPYCATRRAAYARQYNIAFKIARAKQAGELAAIFGDESCEFCGQPLCSEILHFPVVDPANELRLLKRRVMVLELLLRPGNDEAALMRRPRSGSHKITSAF